MEEQAKTIAELLKLLANEHRLLILCALIKGQLTVGDIHKCVPNITASALSQHLNQLKTAGILSSEKQGMNRQVLTKSTHKMCYSKSVFP